MSITSFLKKLYSFMQIVYMGHTSQISVPKVFTFLFQSVRELLTNVLCGYCHVLCIRVYEGLENYNMN